MEKKLKINKAQSKKIQKILKQFKTGSVEIIGSQWCKPRVVNFFGDVHTQVFTVQASPDDQLVAAGCSNGDVKLYNIYQGALLTTCNSSKKGGYPNTSIRWKPGNSGQYTACNSDGTIKWYEKHSQMLLGHHQAEQGYLCCDYQRVNGEWSAYGNQDCSIELFDHETKKSRQKYLSSTIQLPNQNHNNRIFSIKCLPQDSNIFFSGGWDSTVRVWDIRVPENSVRKFCGPSISGDSLDYKKGQVLVGNYQNHEILQLWDFKSGHLIQTLNIQQPQHGNSYCFTAAFAQSSEHHVIAAGLSGSNKVKILKDKKLVAQLKFQAAPLSLDFYKFNNKDFLLVGGVQGIIYVIKTKWLG